MNRNLLTEAIALLGLAVIAELCQVTYQAVRKWEKTRFPRTEWTGETDYAARIAAACREKDPGTDITREALLDPGQLGAEPAGQSLTAARSAA